ncbi:MAG: hypothetical protein H0U40_09835 [Chloroflexia bacterium]|nr:hypothetical protein [Chloroflexia bacterium]
MTRHVGAIAAGTCSLVVILLMGTIPGAAGPASLALVRSRPCATPGVASPAVSAAATPNATPGTTPPASPAASPAASLGASPAASPAATSCVVPGATSAISPDPTPTLAMAIDPAAGSAVAAARADAAVRLGGSPDDYAVVSVEAVEWPDASLGCPGDGFAAQVITPGYLIRLASPDGDTLDYHTDASGAVVVTCG